MLGENMGSVYSFKPISDRSARVLILGSMPGKDSLKANQYYANRQNSFWKIMAELTGVPHAAPYEQRTAGLIARGIALWDVLESCIRPGSLDSRIVRSTAKANDFAGFFSRHKAIEIIGFNGATAEAEYNRLVLPLELQIHACRIRLPSTSATNSSMTYQKKLKTWRAELST